MNNLLSLALLLGSIVSSKTSQSSKTPDINITDVNVIKTKTSRELADETASKIEALEKEKDDLFVKINKAIDETIPELEKVNDTDSLTGLEHLKHLKKQIKEIHEADSEELIGGSKENDTNITSTDFRREFSMNIGRKKKKKGGDWLAKDKRDEFYLKLIKSRDKKYTSLPRLQNREKIAKQIQEWLYKRHEEKKKRKEHRAKFNEDYEKCPNYGKGKVKTSGGKRGKKNNILPCCRKCCKKSYLGCL